MEPNINDYRDMITKLDTELLELLSKRLKISQKIGEYKRNNNIPIENKERENELLNFLKSKKILKDEYIDLIWNEILLISKKIQN